MSKSVTIPSNMHPWRCVIDNVAYEYTEGTVQTVPDEVAALIEAINAESPVIVKPATAGQVWMMQSSGEAKWDDITFPTYTLPVATASVLGGVKVGSNIGVTSAGVISVADAGASTKGVVEQGASVADAAGDAPTAAEFKALLDSLRTAGIIATT